MTWEVPTFVEIKMDAEINSYQEDGPQDLLVEKEANHEGDWLGRRVPRGRAGCGRVWQPGTSPAPNRRQAVGHARQGLLADPIQHAQSDQSEKREEPATGLDVLDRDIAWP